MATHKAFFRKVVLKCSTVDTGDAMLARHSDEIAKSEYTFIEYGGNDCDFDWMKIAESPAKDYAPKTTLDIISRWHESYNRALFMIAQETQTPIIDITTPFDTFRGDISSLYCADGIHPNDKGHKMIATTIINSYL